MFFCFCFYQGRDWFELFRKCHHLSCRTPGATSLARATAFNRQNVGEFFNNLASVMERYDSYKLTMSEYNFESVILWRNVHVNVFVLYQIQIPSPSDLQHGRDGCHNCSVTKRNCDREEQETSWLCDISWKKGAYNTDLCCQCNRQCCSTTVHFSTSLGQGSFPQRST